MKHKLRFLTTSTLVLGTAAAAYLLAEPSIEEWLSEARRAEAEAESAVEFDDLRRVMAQNIPVDPSGDQQLLQAIARLEQRGSVTARIQHEAHVGGLRLDGKGEYLQQGRGTGRHVRWLLESQHEGVRASLLQCTDGRFLWTDRHIATGRRIQRVDLWQLRRMSKLISGESVESPSTESAPFLPQLSASFGGLPMVLESLRAHFAFTSPGTFRAPENLGLGAQPVLGLIGRWRPESLATVVADLSKLDEGQLTPQVMTERLQQRLASGALPARMPINVLVLLGAQDLFPYLIEYRSADDVLASADVPPQSLFQLSRQPLARLEFYDVVFDREINNVEFIYEPPVEPAWYDGTDTYVDRMQQRYTIQLAQQRGRRMATERDGGLR
jgi:hypothetical protein